MRRKIGGKKITSGVLGIAMLVSLAACGGQEGSNDQEGGTVSENPEALVIGIPQLGYGTDWLEALAQRYTEKTGVPVTVQVDQPNVSYGTRIQSGVVDYDIYCDRIAGQQIVKSVGTDALLHDMTGMYETANPYDGGRTTIKDKLKKGYLRYNEYTETDGSIHYYGLQYVDSIQGIIRNLDVWDEAWPVPRTTDELLELCRVIKADGCTPFIWSSQDSYWQNFYPVWVYQYQGYEDMMDFWDGKAPNGDENSADMWEREGWLKALEVMEELLLPANEYQDAYSLSVDFTSAQSYFLGGTRSIAMMVNGDWIINEMKNNYANANMEMLRTPVLSAVIEVLPEQSVSDDAELGALIDAIDAGNTALSGDGYEVTQADYDYVKECRSYYPNLNGHHQFLIPVNAVHKEQAEDFLMFCASDEGMMLMAETAGGFMAPYQYTEEQLAKVEEGCTSGFMKSCVQMHKGEIAPTNTFRSKLFTVGGLPTVPNYNLGGLPEILLSAGDTGYMDAKTIYNKNLGNLRSAWYSITQKAGIN